MLVVKSVPRAVRPKSFFAALSVLLMIAATLFGANVASGDEVWHKPGVVTKLGQVGQRGSRWLGV